MIKAALAVLALAGCLSITGCSGDSCPQGQTEHSEFTGMQLMPIISYNGKDMMTTWVMQPQYRYWCAA